MIEGFAARLFRRHIRRRSHRHAWIGQPAIRCHRRSLRRRAGQTDWRRHLREAKVQDLCMAPPGHEEIGRLDIAMNDPVRVRGVERIADLHRDVDERTLR